ncbi:MAG: tetratricopeptide repeat protein, partial [Alphaproteobacteria bacterium]|nr:tetratricopeptide repeat protein [Alphaproteobacteria bacterium]
MRYLGKVYKSLGYYEKAKNVLEESFSISRKYVSENPEKSAVTLAYLGNIYRKLGNLEKAK